MNKGLFTSQPLSLQIVTWVTPSCYLPMRSPLVTPLEMVALTFPLTLLLFSVFLPFWLNELHLVLGGVLWWHEGPNGLRQMAASRFWLPDGSLVGAVSQGPWFSSMWPRYIATWVSLLVGGWVPINSILRGRTQKLSVLLKVWAQKYENITSTVLF